MYLRLVRDAVPQVFDPGYTFVPGAVHQLREGGDVALVSTGGQTARVVEAAEHLASAGIAAMLVHIPTIKPLDAEMLVKLVGGAPLVVTVEDHSVHGGLGGLVAEVLTSAGSSPPIDRIGLDDTWGESAGNDFLLDKHGLSATRIAERVQKTLASRS